MSLLLTFDDKGRHEKARTAEGRNGPAYTWHVEPLDHRALARTKAKEKNRRK